MGSRGGPTVTAAVTQLYQRVVAAMGGRVAVRAGIGSGSCATRPSTRCPDRGGRRRVRCPRRRLAAPLGIDGAGGGLTRRVGSRSPRRCVDSTVETKAAPSELGLTRDYDIFIVANGRDRVLT